MGVAVGGGAGVTATGGLAAAVSAGGDSVSAIAWDKPKIQDKHVIASILINMMYLLVSLLFKQTPRLHTGQPANHGMRKYRQVPMRYHITRPAKQTIGGKPH
jgi:hypothetical protein